MKRSRQGTTPAREVLTGCAKLRSLASGPAWQTLSHRAEPCRRCKGLLQGIVGHVERLHDVIRDPPAADAPRLSLCDDWSSGHRGGRRHDLAIRGPDESGCIDL